MMRRMEVKKELFVWLPFRDDYPNISYNCDAWDFRTRTAYICVHGPSVAHPEGYQVHVGRKHYATLEEAQKAALKSLRVSLRKARRDVESDLAEAGN